MKKLIVIGTCGVLLLTGCGTRADDSDIQAGAGGGTVSLSQQTLDELRAATGAAAGTGATGATGATTGAVTAPTGGAATTTGGAAATAPGTTANSAPTTGGAATTANGKGGGTNPAAAAAGNASTASAPACTAAGAPVNIGQVGTFSGVTGPAWAGGRTSLSVWVKDVNARGGVACHPVVLHFADDGGDPARAAALVQDQVKNGTVAFVGGHDDLSIAGFKQGIETAKVPAVGGDDIAIEWNQSPYLFPQGAGIIDQIFGLMKQNVDAGAKKLGLLYCVEVAACSVANKAINQDGLAGKAGASVVYSSAISLTQTDFTAQCQSAKNAGADQLGLAMDGSSMARVARSCAAVGYKPLLGGIGGTISPGQAEDPNLRAFTLSTASGTAPWTVFDTPGLKAYKAAMSTYAPGEEDSGSSVQMFAAGKLFEAAIAKLGASAKTKPLTPQMIIDGLHQIKNDTLGGLTGPLTFPNGPTPSNGCFFYEKLTASGWTAPRGTKPVCHSRMSPHRAAGAARRAPALLAVAGVTALALLLSGCGTRAPDSEIQAGSGGGPVTLDESSIAAVKSALPAAGSAPTGSTAPGTAPAAPTVTGGAPSTGASTPNSPAGGQPAAANPGAPAAPTAVAASCATKGAPVAIGQVGTYSGVTGSISAPGRTALAVWAQDINARGGLACHPVTVFNRDDGGDPSRAAAEVADLVNVQKIVALVGSTVAFSVSGFRSAVEAAKIPAIGGELIAPDWHESPWMFPQGASIGDQIVGLIKQSADNGKKKLAYLYCVEVSACTYADKVIQAGAAKRAGAEIVYKSAISITQTDFTAQCQNAKNAGANQIALGMDGSAMIRVARSCSALGYKPVFSGVGGTISPAQSTDELLRSFNLATATSVAPWMLSDTPGLKQYQAALARYAPGLAPDGASISVWTSAALLEKAVALAGDAARTGPLTTALVVTGLGKVKNETLGGLTGPLTFKPGEAKATSSACLFYELLTPQGWTAPRGSKVICV